jgi:hypothetical protein
MKTYGNIVLMAAICIFIFGIFMAVRPTPADAGWRIYYKNSCAWSISKVCANKRAQGYRGTPSVR